MQLSSCKAKISYNNIIILMSEYLWEGEVFIH